MFLKIFNFYERYDFTSSEDRTENIYTISNTLKAIYCYLISQMLLKYFLDFCVFGFRPSIVDSSNFMTHRENSPLRNIDHEMPSSFEFDERLEKQCFFVVTHPRR